MFASTESAGGEQRGVQRFAWLEAGQAKENKRTFLNVGSSVALRLGGSGRDWRRKNEADGCELPAVDALNRCIPIFFFMNLYIFDPREFPRGNRRISL